MKIYFFIVAIVLFSFSCTFSKYGFPYKTKVKTEEIGNTIFITIDTSEMRETVNYLQLDRNKKGSKYFEGGSVWNKDTIQAFFIETFSDTFTVDFEFYYKRDRVKIDSFSFICTMDSIRIDTSYQIHEVGHEMHGATNFFHFTNSNQIIFPQKIRLIQNLIIYSDEKIFRFNNYFLWF